MEPPPPEWQLAFANEEGRVFHRTGGPLARVRSVNWIDSLPNQEFASATILRIDDSRQRVAVDEDGRVLVWMGEHTTATPSASVRVPASDDRQARALQVSTGHERVHGGEGTLICALTG